MTGALSEHRVAGRVRRARREGVHQDGAGPDAGRSRGRPVAAGAAAVPARNEPAGRVRGRRRAGRQHQAGGVGGRRGIDRRLRSSTSRCNSEGEDSCRDEACAHIDADHDRAAGQAPRVRGVRQDRRALGAPADVPAVRRDALLRQLTQPSREQACARDRASGDRLRRTRRALVVLLPGRGVCRGTERSAMLAAAARRREAARSVQRDPEQVPLDLGLDEHVGGRIQPERHASPGRSPACRPGPSSPESSTLTFLATPERHGPAEPESPVSGQPPGTRICGRRPRPGSRRTVRRVTSPPQPCAQIGIAAPPSRNGRTPRVRRSPSGTTPAMIHAPPGEACPYRGSRTSRSFAPAAVLVDAHQAVRAAAERAHDQGFARPERDATASVDHPVRRRAPIERRQPWRERYGISACVTTASALGRGHTSGGETLWSSAPQGA